MLGPRAITSVLSNVVYARELREHRKTHALGFRLSWA
jgi:hypothetical protein